MTLYWLSRNGCDPAGPYLPSQLKLMWTQGGFTAEDMLAQDGTEDWQPASVIMGEAPPAGSVPVRGPKKAVQPQFHSNRGGWMPEDSNPEKSGIFMKVLVVLAAFVCVPVILYFQFAPTHEVPKPVDPKAELRKVVREWAMTRMSDVEILEVGDALAWDDLELHVARIRGRGTSGSLATATYVIQYARGSRQVVSSWTPDEWDDRYGKTNRASTYQETARAIFAAKARDAANAPAFTTRDSGEPDHSSSSIKPN